MNISTWGKPLYESYRLISQTFIQTILKSSN